MIWHFWLWAPSQQLKTTSIISKEVKGEVSLLAPYGVLPKTPQEQDTETGFTSCYRPKGWFFKWCIQNNKRQKGKSLSPYFYTLCIVSGSPFKRNFLWEKYGSCHSLYHSDMLVGWLCFQYFESLTWNRLGDQTDFTCSVLSHWLKVPKSEGQPNSQTTSMFRNKCLQWPPLYLSPN